MKLGRLSRPQSQRPLSDINITPLVDVVLVLLVIFMLAAPLMAQQIAQQMAQRHEVPPPAAPALAAAVPVAEPAQAVLRLRMDAQGRVYWADEAAPALSAPALQQRLRDLAAQQPDTEVQVQADSAVPHGQVLAVLALAQQAGLSRLGLLTEGHGVKP